MKLNTRSTSPYISVFKRVMVWTAVCVFPIVALFMFSGTAHASLISFVNSIVGGEQVSANVKTLPHNNNLQTISILEAHTNINPTSDMAMETVPVDGGEILSADIAASNATDTDPGSSQISTYIVRSGDTLSTIAKMFDVSVNTIVWANNISRSSALQAGQTLVILPVSGINYTVKKGDKIGGIVSKYKADLNEVLSFNDLTVSTPLQVGQTIIIPDAELSSGDVAQSQPVTTHGHIRVAPNEPLLEGWNWPAMPGYFIRPITGGIKTQGLHGHNAVDLAASVGTPIHASASGVVIISRNNGWNGGYGNFVVISHPNGTQTLYAHMSRTSVTAGETVSQGQTIGYIGMTGLTTGPHVHFEIRGAQNPF